MLRLLAMKRYVGILIVLVLASAWFAAWRIKTERIKAERIAAVEKLGGAFLEDGKSLNLVDSEVTDARLVHLEGLTGLEWLNLDGTKITDAGLVHLEGLTGLEELFLDGTRVTDAGVKKLQSALPNCMISY